MRQNGNGHRKSVKMVYEARGGKGLCGAHVGIFLATGSNGVSSPAFGRSFFHFFFTYPFLGHLCPFLFFLHRTDHRPLLRAKKGEGEKGMTTGPQYRAKAEGKERRE